jgi:signal transduction histidine kinase/ActR/RegA family two-component response regulator
MSDASARTGALWALRGLAVASVVLPLLVFVAGGFLSWRSIVHEADSDLLRTLAVAQEQTTRVLDTHLLLGARVNDLIGDPSDETIIARERELHDRLSAMIAGYSQVTAILVVSGDGRALVATSQYPVDRSVDFRDRENFVALRDSTEPSHISGVLYGRISRTDVFSVATRRGHGPGRFAGMVLVGVPPSYFTNFYRQLFAGDTDYSAALIRDDGTLLASYPPQQQFPADAIARLPPGRPVHVRSSADGTDRLIAYRDVANYPVHVVVARRWGSIIRAWRATMTTHLIFGVPATLGLLALSLLALRQARRQTGTLARLQDEIQRRELAEEALRQSQKMEAIGRLTGGIAHDFNNHLTVISSNIELLQRRLPKDNELVARLTNAAMAGVQRAATLTHRLLAFSRQQPLDPEPLDVGKLVAEMSELLSRTIGETIAIETALANSLWHTRVDGNQLENVLLNLAVNGRDAMPGGGRLTIGTANVHLDARQAAPYSELSPGDYVMLAVSDTGCGMSPEVMSKAFDPFFTTKPSGQGTGLGLSMVYGFIRQSGGDVTIESTLGEGTTVKVYLPRFVHPETRIPATSRPTVARTGGKGETILVVEDDADVRRASVEALRELGYDVLEAADAMDGVRLIADQGGIDLLFTDLGLPGGVSGRDLADAARRARPGLSVLLTTGHAHAIVADEGLDEGVYFIAKPFDLTALAAKIREVLGHRTAATSGAAAA